MWMKSFCPWLLFKYASGELIYSLSGTVFLEIWVKLCKNGHAFDQTKYKDFDFWNTIPSWSFHDFFFLNSWALYWKQECRCFYKCSTFQFLPGTSYKEKLHISHFTLGKIWFGAAERGADWHSCVIWIRNFWAVQNGEEKGRQAAGSEIKDIVRCFI